MLSFIEKNFNSVFRLITLIMFVVIALRAFMIPFTQEEASAFFTYIQNGNYLPYAKDIYTNNHFLNSLLSHLFYLVGGSHPFVQRLPNVLAFLVFAYGVRRHFRYFTSLQPKVVLLGFFILSFNFLDVFQQSRGYGISLALITLGSSFLVDYFISKEHKHFLYFSLLWQLALCANFGILMMFLVLLCYVGVFQYKNKFNGQRLLYQRKNLVLQSLNLGLIIFWFQYFMLHKDKNLPDYGNKENLWDSTFTGMMEFFYGSDVLWFQIACGLVYAIVFIYLMIDIWNDNFFIRDLFKIELFYPFAMLLAIGAYFMQKKLLHIQYPDGNSGAFFFVFFVMSVALMIEKRKSMYGNIGAIVLVSAVMLHLAFSVNLSHFTSWRQQTIPGKIFAKLMEESKNGELSHTLGGRPSIDQSFAFMNYRAGSPLTLMDAKDEMQMNCDYYYAMKREAGFYSDYYDVIEEDQQWGHVLLKRKEALKHEMLVQSDSPLSCEGNSEFYDLKRLRDTSFLSHEPIEVEARIQFDQVPSNFNAFFVLSLNNGKGESAYYKRIPLNWLSENLSGQTKTLKLTTGNLPDTMTNFVLHVWNIDKEPLKLTMKDLKIYRLKGKGVDMKVPSSYYKLLQKITKQPMY